jgi:hypothetical protein
MAYAVSLLAVPGIHIGTLSINPGERHCCHARKFTPDVLAASVYQ